MYLVSSEHDATTAYETFLLPLQRRLRTICIFGGARCGHDPQLASAAEALGAAIGSAGLNLVYGGGGGLIGSLAETAARHGAAVTVITPRFLIDAIPAPGAGRQVIIAPDMHTRKRLLFDYADAFIALPGGIGTVEAIADVLAWRELDQHCKPVVIANFAGFWSPLLALLGHLDGAGFLDAALLGKCLVADTPEAILPLLTGPSWPQIEAAE